jgi:Mrr N-terminal domain
VSHTIRIDNEVLDKLKERAEPFVDTPNSVLRQILGLAPAVESGDIDNGASAARPSPRARLAARPGSSRPRRRRTRAPRAKPGTTLSDAEYEVPILEILRDNGGRAPTREVIDALGEQLDGRLSEADRQPLASGEIRWRNRAQFARLNLIEQGDMVRGSPRGVWEISEQGRERVGSERRRRA